MQLVHLGFVVVLEALVGLKVSVGVVSDGFICLLDARGCKHLRVFSLLPFPSTRCKLILKSFAIDGARTLIHVLQLWHVNRLARLFRIRSQVSRFINRKDWDRCLRLQVWLSAHPLID